MLKNFYKLVFLLCALYSVASFAVTSTDTVSRHPFYVGITGGYGDTTWGQLVPPKNKLNDAVALSTPSGVNEGGAIWGLFAGYELIPMFAVEAAYTRYRIADVLFDQEYSIFVIENDGLRQFSTRTDMYSVSGKFMLEIPHTPLKAFSSAGVAGVHRSDMLTNRWRVSPTFGLGLDYNITPHIMLEIGGNYTGGYGESELDPINDYIPFLYSGFVYAWLIAFRISPVS